MIFLDANCFLRWLVDPPTIEDRQRADLVEALFDRLRAGEAEATTSEAIIAEVAYILTSKRQYHLPVPVAAGYIAVLLEMPGLKIPGRQKRQWLLALETWAAHPALEFVDALTYAIVTDQGHELASFDRDFARFPDVRIYWPAE